MNNLDGWATQILSDPDHGHRLYRELLWRDQFVGEIFLEDGKIKLRTYPGFDVTFDFEWLTYIATQFLAEMQEIDSRK